MVTMLGVNRRMPWKPGPADPTGAPVLISVTDFGVHRWRDLPRVWITGIRLRSEWPHMEGAVGMWLWADPLCRHSGSISVWTDERALLGFVGWPVHVAIMRRYRDRGTLRSTSWHADRFDRAEAIAIADRWLSERG
jgi:hypothetical protein